jgi:hypothetical protein
VSVVTEVHSIASATDWFVEDYEVSRAADLEPLACFALVSVFDPTFPHLAPEKMVVPISAEQLSEGLIGKPLADFKNALHGPAARATLG